MRCVQLTLSCDFKAEYHRGRPPSPEWSGLTSPLVPPQQSVSPPDTAKSKSPQHHRKNSSLSIGTICNAEDEAASQDDPEYIRKLQTQLVAESDRQNYQAAYLASRNSPEPSQMDSQGQYVGSSSGIAFLARVQRKLHDIDYLNDSSSILTFGDPALPDYSSFCFIMPPKAEAKRLLDFYFSYVMPTYRFLHQPTVEQWFDEFYESFDVLEPKEGARERNAIIILLLAQAKKYPSAYKQQDNYVDNSAVYFHAAEQQLAMETGRPRLSSVQARLCQCFYLLCCSRINHCRSLFGSIAHLIQALGLHRWQKHVHTVDYIEQETRKRVFWSAYSLDKYLSAVLGRPSIFHDSDIDQELPLLVNDSDLTAKHINFENYKTVNCIMLAPVLHTKLVRMLSGILRDIYGIRQISHGERIALCKKYTAELKSWYDTLPAFLDPARVQASLLMTLLQRQSRMLSLAYAHALILVNRPYLLASFALLTPGKNGFAESEFDADHEVGIQECLSAAMIVVDTIDGLSRSGQVFSALWFTQYVAFCSVVVLYVYCIRCRSEAVSQVSIGERKGAEAYLDAAQKCQRQLSSAAKENSLAQRYLIILEELRVEATREKEQNEDNASTFESQQFESQPQLYVDDQTKQHPRFVARNLAALRSGQVMSHEAMLSAEDVELSSAVEGFPMQMIQDFASWENFDTLVMDFLGNNNMPYAV